MVDRAGRTAVLVPGDLANPAHCRSVIDRAVGEFGRVDVLVSNAPQQRTLDKLEDIPDDEWDRTVAVNLERVLAPDEASYISGARIAVTGGKPIL